MTQIDSTQIRSLFKDYDFKKYKNNSNFNTTNTNKKEIIITNY